MRACTADAARPTAWVVAVAGVIALACFVVNAAERISRGEATDILWTCHMGCLVVGAGAVAKARRTVAVGLSWLIVGTPFWLLDLAGGAELIPASLFTHVGGVGVGFGCVRLLGVPRGVWLWALVALIALQGLTRLLVPPVTNVNLAFSVWPGYERVFHSYPAYWAAMLVFFAVAFRGIEWALRRVFP